MVKTTMFERSRTRVRFANEDMDYLFLVLLGYHTHGGASFGELFRAAAGVEDGDPESWIGAFCQMGERIEGQARELEERGKRSAASAHLRAFTGYRAAAFLMNPKADFGRFAETVESFVGCFRKAIPSFGYSCEPIRVPFEENYMSGYFYGADDRGMPRPTLIAVGGGDTYAEDLHFWAGAAGPERGYNVLSLELPGYGMSPTRGLYLLAGLETPMRAAVDYAIGRPEVDGERLAAYGISGGGYAVTRTVATEERIRAAIATTPIYDIYRLITEAIPNFLLDESHGGVSRWLLEVSGRFNKAGKNNMDKFAWQSGKGSLLEAVRVTEGEPVNVGAIRCPMLCLAAEGDPPEALEQTKYVFDQLEHPKKAMRILTADEGAEAHTHVNNFPLLHQVVFDWLDEALTPMGVVRGAGQAWGRSARYSDQRERSTEEKTGVSMRATVYIATSVDGFIAREDGGVDWLPDVGGEEGGEDYGYQEFIDSVDAIVMGRSTYELAASFGAWPYGEKPVVVLSSRHVEIPEAIVGTVESMSAPPREVVRRLEERGFGHLYVDGGKTIQGFLGEGLIDRLIITKVPVLIGAGISLFGPLPHDVGLRHLATRQFENGLVQSEYEVLENTP